MRFAACLSCVLLLCSTPASHATAQVVDDSGLWLAIFGQDDLRGPKGKWKWWFDGHLRFLEDTDGFNQSIVRPGIGRKIGGNWTAWAGYGWIHTSPIAGDDYDEHRLWQQLTWFHNLGSWTFALRPRLEQRLVETGDDLGWRYRQLVRAQRNFPVFPRFSFVAWDEFFYHLNDTDWGGKTGFDQNRVFVGLGVKRHAHSRLRSEIGYLNQSVELPAVANRSNHILSINLYY